MIMSIFFPTPVSNGPGVYALITDIMSEIAGKTDVVQDVQSDIAPEETRKISTPPEEYVKPLFPHRPWMTGIILILAVVAILGGTVDPFWFWIGLPFILALALYLYVRVRDWLRGERSDLPE